MRGGLRRKGGLIMKVGDVCNREVVCISGQATLLEASHLMREEHVGCLVVVEGEEDQAMPVGIVTDRDILLEVISEGVSLEKITVEDIMSSDLVTARKEDDFFEIIQKMRSKGIRRVPIVDGKMRLVGILALDDVFEILSSEMRNLSGVFVREQEREVLRRP